VSESAVEVPPKPFWKRKGCLFGALGVAVLLLLLCLAAAIVIPSGLGSPVSRSTQKRPVSEVRTIAVAVQSYQTDNLKAPVPPGFQPGGGWSFVPVSSLAPVLSPDYIRALPETDPWGQPYLYGLSAENPEWFCVLSTGKDEARDSETLPQAPVTTHCWESDFVWMNSEFLQFPEGKQGKCGKGGG
jgi:type II secretory pathway pseudopilin PulG